MEAWGNDKTNGGKSGRRTEPRETQLQKKADHALDRAYRWLDWMDSAADAEPEHGLQWLPGRRDRWQEVRYEVVSKERDEQINLVSALAKRNPLHGVLYLVLASVEPLSSKELGDLLTITLTAEQYNQALVELEVNGLIKVKRADVAE